MGTSNEELLPNEIVTSRLRLRPYRFSDVPEMFAYLQEPWEGEYLEGPEFTRTEAEVEAIIARHILVNREQRSVWAITIDDRPVGAITINFSKERRIAEIGYHVKRSLWGQGLASEAAEAVIDAAFANCSQLQRIQANIHPENIGSIRVVERAGMTFEGTLRSYAYIAGKAADEAVYSLVRSRLPSQSSAQPFGPEATGMLIREVTLDDITACEEILLSLPEWFGIDESNQAYLKDLLANPGAVAVDNNSIVGFIGLLRHTEDSYEINVMGVHPSLHRRGVGSELIGWAENWCRERGVSWLHLKTRGPSTPDRKYARTRKFYASRGYSPIFESLTLWGEENAALVFVKHLERQATA
jgi:RimJ/RimL family protein N-acetyltransferase/GNAT superfamily N-acetyltransferase